MSQNLSTIPYLIEILMLRKEGGGKKKGRQTIGKHLVLVLSLLAVQNAKLAVGRKEGFFYTEHVLIDVDMLQPLKGDGFQNCLQITLNGTGNQHCFYPLLVLGDTRYKQVFKTLVIWE